MSEPCKRYNQGFCPYGSSCKFEHRCVYADCLRFGHSILNCRKLAADRDKANNKSDKKRDSHGDGGSRHKEHNHHHHGSNVASKTQ